jgi:hypothetical protein
MIMAWHHSNHTSKRLHCIPGVGQMLATALVASVAYPKTFRSGRNFSGWIGLVSKQHSSGGKEHSPYAKVRTRGWVLGFERRTPPFIEPLMGWTEGDDTMVQVELSFPNRAAAVVFAERQGLNYRIEGCGLRTTFAGRARFLMVSLRVRRGMLRDHSHLLRL